MAGNNRPLPAHSEPDGRNPNFSSNSGASSCLQQDPGPHIIAQDPGFPPHPIFTRPMFYIHAPPPPPLLHYQWPMPFSYNPYSGFPGMGYGMVVPPPPFPPPPYMDSPGYIRPHPPVQPVDYRRLHNQQTHSQGASYQNPNQTRRIRPNFLNPIIETVNSEVQTEPEQRDMRGYNLGSDSGRGSCSNSPCSPALSSPKQTETEVVNCKSPCREGKDLYVLELCKDTSVNASFHKQSEGSSAVELCERTSQDTPSKKDLPDQKPIPTSYSTDGECNLWLTGSPGSVVPVSSSSRKEAVVLKERRVSVPDILMNWGGGTPQSALLKTDVELSHTDEQSSHNYEVQNNKPLSHSSIEANTGSVSGFSTDIAEDMGSPKVNEMLFRILRLPHSMIDALMESSMHEEQVEGSFSERHSLTFRDEVQYLQYSSHNNSAEGHENSIGRDLQDISDVAPHMSASKCKAKRKLNESTWSVESLPIFIPNKEWLLKIGMYEDGSSEPEASQSPNQNTVILNEQQQKSLSSSEGEMFLKSVPEETSSSAIQLISRDGVDMKNGVSILVKNMPEAPPSKETLVDCGVQCNEIHQPLCLCKNPIIAEAIRRLHFELSENKANDGRNGHVHENYQWKGTDQERQLGQQEATSEYSGEKGKDGRKP